MRLIERVRRFRKEWAEAKRLQARLEADRARRAARAKVARPVRTKSESDAIVIANAAACAGGLAVVTA